MKQQRLREKFTGDLKVHLQNTHRHSRVCCTDSRRWNTWLLTDKLCSSRNGGSMMPPRTGNVNLSWSLSSGIKKKRSSPSTSYPRLHFIIPPMSVLCNPSSLITTTITTTSVPLSPIHHPSSPAGKSPPRSPLSPFPL